MQLEPGWYAWKRSSNAIGRFPGVIYLHETRTSPFAEVVVSSLLEGDRQVTRRALRLPDGVVGQLQKVNCEFQWEP